MHIYSIIIIKANDNIIFSRCLVPSREEGPGEDPGREDLNLGRLWGLQNGLNKPNKLCKEYNPNTFPSTPWKFKIGGNKFKENYYKFIEVRNRENFSYQLYSYE